MIVLIVCVFFFVLWLCCRPLKQQLAVKLGSPTCWSWQSRCVLCGRLPACLHGPTALCTTKQVAGQSVGNKRGRLKARAWRVG